MAKKIKFSQIIGFGLFVCVNWAFVYSAVAQQAVYKCGQEITNQPLDAQRCERLNISQPTQIEGTRVQQSVASEVIRVEKGHAQTASSPRAQEASPQSTTAQELNLRNVQARTILEDEWQKLSAKHAELVRLYNKGQPALLAGETTQQTNYQERAQDLKFQLHRTERDMQALQRELSRHGKHAHAVPNN